MTRSVRMVDAERDAGPRTLASIGLGSNMSSCEGPPVMKRKMTCFALGGRSGTHRAQSGGCLGGGTGEQAG